MRKIVRNQELFFAVADQVQFDSNSYSQASWGYFSDESNCGTTGCIAGHALLLSGWRLVGHQEFHQDNTRIGHPEKIGKAAAKVLGLTSDEQRLLFSGFWRPRDDLTVPEALRLIGKGENISEVSRDDL